MNFKLTNFTRATGAFLALFAIGLPPMAGADEPGTGSVTLSGAVADVSGDNNAFQTRHQVSADGFGGVETLNWEKTYGDGTLSIDGRAMFGNNDYNIVLKYVAGDRYTIEAGYREFRTWYDPTGTAIASVIATSGGLAATTLYEDQEFAIDRSRLWIDGKFVVTPNFNVHLAYTRNERSGTKDSTSQADTNLTGGLGTRSIVPSFYDIDETQDVYLVEGTYHDDKTEVVAAAMWDNRMTDNARNEHRRPGEAGQDRSISHIETNDSELFNARGYVRHQYNDKLAFNGAYSHTKVDNVLGGSRIYGPDFYSDWNPTWANRQARDEGFFDLVGAANTKLDVWNVNLMYTPIESFTVVPSFRASRETREVETEFEETNFSTAKVAQVDEIVVLSDRNWDEWTFNVESRYTGIKKLVLIGRAQWSKGDGELAEDNLEEGITSLVNRDSEITKWTEKYSLTANVYPNSGINLSFIYSYWDRYTDYDTLATSANSSVSSGDRYPAFIKSLALSTNDFAARVTLRPSSAVTLVSRLDIQKTNLDANQLGLELIESGTYDTTIYSQSVNWTPRHNVFFQTVLNYVEDRLHTPASEVGGAAANQVQEQVSDYWSANATVGFVIDEQDTLTLSYDHFFSENFVDNSAQGVPYGLDRRDFMAGATWTRNLGDKMTIAFRYAYAKNIEDSALGLNDYEANLFYGKLEYRF